MSKIGIHRRSRMRAAMASTTAIAIALAAGYSTSAYAQGNAVIQEEIIVTGSRIVREGYEAPTPTTVVGVEALQNSADSNLITFLSTIPAITGSSTPTSGGTSLSPGTAGLQTVNLRSMGSARVLVLLDGRRSVGSALSGIVDLASFPTQLVQRIDVVTGGASAVYGSDAVAGVVNFILDKTYTGVKGEVSGGTTSYGDDKNYKVMLTGGFGFGGGRGHVLLSGEYMHNSGIVGDGGRKWNRTGYQQLVNPFYGTNAALGQSTSVPQQLVMFNAAPATFTPGGIVVSGPLKGTAFGTGGSPFTYNYGSIYSNPFTAGGDWAIGDLRPFSDVDPAQTTESLFTRVSYDVSDNITVFGQWAWNQAQLKNNIAPPWLLGGASGPAIQIDNAYLPASVRAAMVTNSVTSLQLGTTNGDMPMIGNDSLRLTNRILAGFEGKLNAFNTDWSWDATYSYGATKIGFRSPSAPLRSRYNLAIDAVVNPANGQIVCRSTLTNPTNGCRPWNPLGAGVNAANQASFNWINNDGNSSFQHALIEQTTYAASVTGEPLNLWAGPVSLAVSVEHRADKVNAVTDTQSTIGGHILGNLPSLVGQQSVTEGALETVVPLAKGETWAQAWDFTAAARFTEYNLSGFVATYKLGTTYTPIEDVTFRVTRSRDVRAPNLQELFTPVNIGTASPQIIDRGVASNPQYPLGTTNSTGNSALLPEKAKTTGIGIVLRPSFLEGFTTSVDFWDVDIKGAIQPLSVQQVIDTCYNGQFPSVCENITRSPTSGQITRIRTYSINLATQNVRGIDLEASYRTQLADIIGDLPGALSLHGNMTFYLKSYQDNTFSKPTDRVGENNGSNPPDWKLTATASYALDPVTLSLTARAIPHGTINATYVECTTGCPVATTDNPTINKNRVDGRFYMDANVSYKLVLGNDVGADIFFSAKNLFNADPPPLVTNYFANLATSGTLYDAFGTVYRAGIRFKM